MPSAAPDPRFVNRFHRGLTRVAATTPAFRDPFDAGTRFGLAVSGGPDSLALLLLARTRFPGQVAAATFDHGFRAESAAEAGHVAAICQELGVPHTILAPGCRISFKDWTETGRRKRGGQMALARAWRYRALERWCRSEGCAWLLTGHHADDQAETVLMRLARGSGARGLSGIRRALTATCAYAEAGQDTMTVGRTLIGRPLLDFAKAELMAIVAAAGLEPVDDPSNADERHDRTHVRKLLADAQWLDPRRLVAVADAMRDCDQALAWATDRIYEAHVRPGPDDDHVIDPDGLPPAILRRLCEIVMARIEEVASGGARELYISGPELSRFIERLRAGETATFSLVMARPGATWHFSEAPARRAGPPSHPSASLRPATDPPGITTGPSRRSR